MDQPYSTYSANYMTPTQQQNPACPYNSGMGGFKGLPQLSGAIPQLSGQAMPGTYPSSGQSQMNNTPMIPGSGAPSAPSGLQVPTQEELDRQPITDLTQPMPVTAESLQYLNGFLRTQIGRKVHVEFLIGSNTMTDRTGVLVAVGANYILLNELETDDLLACDYYNIKFIRFYY